MNIDLNVETMQRCCRICLQEGDVNIWNYNFKFKPETEIGGNDPHVGDFTEKSFLQIMEIFYKSQEELLDLTDEFPLLCWQCIEDLKFCFIMCEKIRHANIQLKNLYQEFLNRCIEEEHLVEILDEEERQKFKEKNESNLLPVKEIVSNEHQCNATDELQTTEKSNDETEHFNSIKNTLQNENDSFVITQFVPTTLELPERNFLRSSKDADEYEPPQHLFTMKLKAVEVKDLNNLQTHDFQKTFKEEMLKPAIFMCQYCPNAFAKFEYLKTHIQKSHVCKYCTKAFSLTEDLYKHLREVHTEHKCAICHKILSSHTNLRHHIRRVHRINLPAKVTLIDFIKSNVDTNIPNNELNISQDGMEDIDSSIQYVWESDDNIEMLTGNNTKNN